MMPTTRRGRYLYYRAKAKRRHKLLWARKASPSVIRKHEACRSYDLASLLQQQEKVTGLKYVQSPRPPGYWLVAGRVKPDFKIWGVVPNPLGHTKPFHPTSHWQTASVFYAHRRVKHVPRPSTVPRLPYLFPISGVFPFSFWPWPFYPSGQANPRNWKP